MSEREWETKWQWLGKEGTWPWRYRLWLYYIADNGEWVWKDTGFFLVQESRNSYTYIEGPGYRKHGFIEMREAQETAERLAKESER